MLLPLLLSLQPLVVQDAPARPNILVIVCDDAGMGDVGCYGNHEVRTPNIDSLARDGVRFAAGYVCISACSPSRAGLLTGRHPARFGHEFNIGKERERGDERDVLGLPVGERTLADELGALGYHTGMLGKWHLGSAEHFRPLARGFDEFVGFLHGPPRYRYGRAKHADDRLMRGDEDGGRWDGHLSAFLAAEAASFVRRSASEPFFLYLCFKSPHSPAEAAPEDLEAFAHVEDEQRRAVLALMLGLDRAVGQVLAALDETGVAEDTLVVFLSDNGAPRKGGGSNGPLRGGKGSHLEGGLRVPFLARWPARLPVGVTVEHPVSSLDVFPTALAAAGGTPGANLDGVDLVPYLTSSRAEPPHEALFWRAGRNASVRRGQWKLVTCDDVPIGLYDLESDPGETVNGVRDEPALVKELLDALMHWDAGRRGPAWKGSRARR